jgi:hypothetical protein
MLVIANQISAVCLPFPLQVGAFLDYNPLLGPTLVSLGLLLLILWDFQENWFNLIPIITTDHTIARGALAIPFAVGFSLATTGALVLTDSLGLLVIALFCLGRLVEASTLVYQFRKIFYYACEAVSWAKRTRVFQFVGSSPNPKRSNSESVGSRIKGKLREKFVLAIVKAVFVYGAVGATVVYVIHTHKGPSRATLIWAVLVAGGVSATILIRIRDIADGIGKVPVIGLLFCIAGTELYNLSGLKFPYEQRVVELTKQTIPQITALPISFQPSDFVLVIIGQLALLVGIVISILFLWSNNRQSASTRAS